MSTLSLPMQYTELDQEEMMYLEGGWSAATFSRNLQDLWKRGSSGALRDAGFSWSSVVAAGRVTYWAACATYGAEVAELGALIGGVVGGLVAGAGAVFAVYYLGNHLVF